MPNLLDQKTPKIRNNEPLAQSAVSMNKTLNGRTRELKNMVSIGSHRSQPLSPLMKFTQSRTVFCLLHHT